MLNAIKENPTALEFCSYQLYYDYNFMMEVIKIHPNNKEILIDALNQTLEFCESSPLVYASEELKKDKEIVMQAVKQSEWALKFTVEELRNDKEIVIEAVKSYRDALHFASQELKNDNEFLYLIQKSK